MAASSSCAPTDRLMQTLKVHVPGATDPVLQLELFNVLDEFFRRTSAWRYASDVTLAEDIVDYSLSVPGDSVMVRVLGVGHNGTPVPPAGSTGGVTISSLGIITPDQVFPDGDATFGPSTSDISGGVFSYAIYRPDYITLTTPPDEEQRKFPLNVVAALSVAKSCLECDCGDWALPDWMYDMYFQDWLDGVLGRLYAMPAKPWAAPVQAQYHHKRFRNRMALRKQEANLGFVYATPSLPLFPRGGWT